MAGLAIGQVIRLVQETRRLEGSSPHIAVAGTGAGELADALREGGDPGAVVVGGDPLLAAVVIVGIAGAPTDEDRSLLRRIARKGTPVIVIRHGRGERIAHVLPGYVLDAETEASPQDLAAAIARVAKADAPALAARLPVLRDAVAQRLILTTAVANALLAAAAKPVPQLPVLTLAQSRMLLLLGLSRGTVLPSDPQQLAVAAGPSLAGALGVGLGARSLVRHLPLRGPLVRAAVAFAGTGVLGAARTRF